MAGDEKLTLEHRAELQKLFSTKITREDGQPILAADGAVPRELLATLLKENPQLATLTMPNGLTTMDYFLYEGIKTPRSGWKAELFAKAAGPASPQAKAYQDMQKLAAWPFRPDGTEGFAKGAEKPTHAEYVEGNSLVDMIRENLVAERIAIDSYREMIQYLGDRDTTTLGEPLGNVGE